MNFDPDLHLDVSKWMSCEISTSKVIPLKSCQDAQTDTHTHIHQTDWLYLDH